VEDYAVSVIFLCLFDSEKGFDFLGSRAAWMDFLRLLRF
jgi:hypothetical protein